MRTPLLLTIYNKTDELRQVWEVIRAAQPPKLYVAADGAKDDADVTKVEAARAIVADVDWACEVEYLFHHENIGIAHNIPRGLDWVFQQEQECVVLEDDLVPDLTFFVFIDAMLDLFRDDDRVFAVGGKTHDVKQVSPYSIRFMPVLWMNAFAITRDNWQLYDPTLSAWGTDQGNRMFEYRVPKHLKNLWRQELTAVQQNPDITWDYQLQMALILSGKWAIEPTINLVSDIGYNANGTYTKDAASPEANIPQGTWMVGELPPVPPRLNVRNVHGL